jgi:hypothetical protein
VVPTLDDRDPDMTSDTPIAWSLSADDLPARLAEIAAIGAEALLGEDDGALCFQKRRGAPRHGGNHRHPAAPAAQARGRILHTAIPEETDYMTALSNTYPSEDTARRAVEALRAAGVPPRDIRLLTSRPPHDLRREPRGGFAGPIGTDAPIGSYAARLRRRSQGAGSFATGSFAGDPDRQRKGCFADVERVAITTYRDAGEHSRGAGHRAVRQLLRRAALDAEAIDGAAKDLHTGHAVVLVDVAEIAPSEAQARLEQFAKAA